MSAAAAATRISELEPVMGREPIEVVVDAGAAALRDAGAAPTRGSADPGGESGSADPGVTVVVGPWGVDGTVVAGLLGVVGTVVAGLLGFDGTVVVGWLGVVGVVVAGVG